jgi:hypothetical protein
MSGLLLFSTLPNVRQGVLGDFPSFVSAPVGEM